MPFKYMNPGYAELLRDCTLKTVESLTFNPINGVCMAGDGEMFYWLPEGCSEVWVKFGFYFDTSNSWDFFCYIGNNQRKFGYCRYSASNSKAYFNGTAFTLPNSTDYKYHTAWIHCKAGNEGLLEIFVDGAEVFSQTGTVTWQSQYVYFKVALNRIYLSNVIISDREIPKTDEVYILTPKTTETDMAVSDGQYTANAEGQYVRQTVDVDALKAKAVSDALQVTGLAVAGVPAYYDGDGLSSLVATKDGSDVGTAALSADAGAGAIVSWEESMSLDALAGISLGWKATQ